MSDWTHGITVPDGFTPIRGARLWYAKKQQGHLRCLKSLHRDEWWPRHRGLQAKCYPANISALYWAMLSPFGSPTAGKEEVKAPDNHEAPHELCDCGFWAKSDPILLPAYPTQDSGTPGVYGVVELWGRVVCGLDGWRGEYARPIAVVQRNVKRVRRAEAEVAATYGIPVLQDWPELSPPTLPEE